MNTQKALTIAGVPKELHAEAIASVNLATKRTDGLLLHKIKVRYLKANKIAKLLEWEDERLCIRHPELASYDIAPMINVTAYGDNGEWEDTPLGGRPVGGRWLNKDPESQEYKDAVAKNYWCKGTHPRSFESHKAWYRRNGGEYLAWERGEAVRPSEGFEKWTGTQGSTQAIAYRADGAWIVLLSEKKGPFRVNSRIGFEVDNVYCGTHSPQAWFPIDGYELRGCATHSVMLGKELKLAPPMWGINFVEPTERGTYLCWPHNR